MSKGKRNKGKKKKKTEQKQTNPIILKLWDCRYIVLLIGATAIALFIRIYYPYDNVFADGWVRFQQNDPWFHMRAISDLVQNFPSLPGVDALGLYPDGLERVAAPLLDILIASVAWVLGAGHPSTGLIESVGAYAPALMGGVLPIPVYFIGRTLFSRTAGVIAALLVAILPGELMFRTLLGFTDHHALEILLSTTFISLFLVAIEKQSKGWALPAGISLGLYLASWTGGALFVFVALTAIAAWYITSHLRGRSMTGAWEVPVVTLTMALVIVAPFWNAYALWGTQVAALLAGIATTMVLHSMSLVFRDRHKAMYLIALVVLAVAGFLVIRATSPILIESALSQLAPSGGTRTISEAKGMSLSSAWVFFGPAFYVSLVALAGLAIESVRNQNRGKMLLVLWSLLMVIAAFSQQRFAYYLGVNVAVLTGYASWRMLKLVLPTKGTQGVIHVAVVLVIIFFVVFFPQIGNAVDWARAPRGPSDDWHETLVWMREETPGGDYGVMSWWDPGYWITYIGHRAPNAIPGGQRGAVDAANFLLAQNEAEADVILDKLGTRYVILDTSNSVVQFNGSNVFGEFHAFVAWANRNNADYYEICYLPSGQNLTPILLYYPPYYQSMSTRLYVFGGDAWTPYGTEVVKIVTQNVTSSTGASMKVNVIQDSKTFTQYSEALAFVERNGEYRIAGREFGASPVPLLKLERFELVHQSPTVVLSRGSVVITEVEVFEYTIGGLEEALR